MPSWEVGSSSTGGRRGFFSPAALLPTPHPKNRVASFFPWTSVSQLLGVCGCLVLGPWEVSWDGQVVASPAEAGGGVRRLRLLWAPEGQGPYLGIVEAPGPTQDRLEGTRIAFVKGFFLKLARRVRIVEELFSLQNAARLRLAKCGEIVNAKPPDLQGKPSPAGSPGRSSRAGAPRSDPEPQPLGAQSRGSPCTSERSSG